MVIPNQAENGVNPKSSDQNIFSQKDINQDTHSIVSPIN